MDSFNHMSKCCQLLGFLANQGQKNKYLEKRESVSILIVMFAHLKDGEWGLNVAHDWHFDQW